MMAFHSVQVYLRQWSVISNQKPYGNRRISKSSYGALKYLWFFFVFLNTEFWKPSAVHAKCLGTHGVIYTIEEQDPIVLIQQKLKIMQENGELKRRNLELQKKARSSIERPKPVEGITKATRNRIFYFDPTYEVKEDLYDHQGRVFAKKGTKLNPLQTVSLSSKLIFFDGDDEDQLVWIKEQLYVQKQDRKPLKLTLTQGAPLKLSEELGIPVCFDQAGILAKKLGIQHVPALVSQEGLQLKIEEIKLPLSRESKREGGI